MKLALNFVLFQLGWFACVLGAAHGLMWLGPLAVLAIVAVHLALSLRPIAELRLVAVATALGLLVESLVLAGGWLSYPGGHALGILAPYWLVAMWALFATTLNVSMRWLRGRPVLAVILGAIGGPLSYFGGQKLGAVTFIEPVPALVALALAWAVAMPLLIRIAARFDGVTPVSTTDLTPLPWRVSGHA
jgi:hypothetical protein